MDQEKIGKFIKDIRIKNNLTQAAFGEKYGVTYQAVSKWENGKNLPDMALIKQISKDYNVNIEDILDGKYISKKKKSYNILFISIIVLLILLLIILVITNDQSFKFKTLASGCNNFNISGSIAYDGNKSSIYISNIEYCGGDDNVKYKEIECTLYETNNNLEKKISSCNYNENSSIKLEDYLKEVSFEVDNYSRVCKDYSNNNLYLLINATDQNDKITSYKIPLSLKDNCTK